MTFAEALFALRQFLQEADAVIECGDLLDAVERAQDQELAEIEATTDILRADRNRWQTAAENAVALAEARQQELDRKSNIIDLLFLLCCDAGLLDRSLKPSGEMKYQRDHLAEIAYDLRVRLDAIRAKLAETEDGMWHGAISPGFLAELRTILAGSPEPGRGNGVRS